MNPTVTLIIEFALKYGIPAARQLVALFQVENPTVEQWEKVFGTAEKTYDQYIAEAAAKIQPPAVVPPLP